MFGSFGTCLYNLEFTQKNMYRNEIDITHNYRLFHDRIIQNMLYDFLVPKMTPKILKIIHVN